MTTAPDVGNATNNRSPSHATVLDAPVERVFFRIAPLAWICFDQTSCPVRRSKA
jgi:hypothetical protein